MSPSRPSSGDNPPIGEAAAPEAVDDGADNEEHGHAEAGERGDEHGGFGRTVATVGALVAIIAAGIGVLFKVDPRIAPCLGGRDASFTGAPVFPHYGYRQFLRDTGSPTAGYPNVRGAEVRYSYQVDDLKNERLVLRITMVSVNRDGSIRSADTNPIDQNDLFVADHFRPDTCSQAGGSTIFAHMPLNASGRYRIILELFIGMGLHHRVALGETPEFSA